MVEIIRSSVDKVNKCNISAKYSAINNGIIQLSTCTVKYKAQRREICSTFSVNDILTFTEEQAVIECKWWYKNSFDYS